MNFLTKITASWTNTMNSWTKIFQMSNYISQMKKLIERDKDFYDPYLVIADILSYEGKEAGSSNIL